MAIMMGQHPSQGRPTMPTSHQGAWVKIMHPFNPHDFIPCLMAQFYANSPCQQATIAGVHVLNKMKGDGDLIIKEFEKLVAHNRFLVVLEGISHMLEWDTIRTFFPDSKNGSSIIVSAQRFQIARLCIGHTYQLTELERFSTEHSVFALFKELQVSEGDEDKEEKLTVCGEVPLPSSEKKEADEWRSNFSLVGRESEMAALGECLAKARLNNHDVMSVHGIRGVGKSALVRNFYYDIMLTDFGSRFQKYSWVNVSYPFNLRDFCRSLLLDFHSETYVPIQECRQLLENYRCLIVIDELCCVEDWDLIKDTLLSRASKSFIIVVTTEPRIATHCACKDGLVLNVKPLQADAASDLFTKEVSRKKPLSSPLSVPGVPVLEEIISKCGGLPKVLVEIAGSLAAKFMDSVSSVNQRFMYHLETKPEFDSLQVLFGWMHSYFRTCPDSLKPCIFYLSIFPRDRIIWRRRLVRRWIAEGYSRDNHEESAEENGEKQFSDLLDLSIIQQAPQDITTTTTALGNNTRMVLCQANGFMHEYIVSRQMEENLVFQLDSSCALTTQRTGRHLAILESWDRDVIVFKSIDFSRLRSLTVFGNWKSFFISASMKMLQVLDLENASSDLNDADVEKMVRLLCRLKFLSLRGHREICRLPSSLGDLRQLQTLDVRDTSIATLPASIIKLQKMQYIRAGATIDNVPASALPVSFNWLVTKCRKRRRQVGVVVPGRIGSLTGLHTLCVVNVSVSRGEAILRELEKLTQLRKLGVYGINMKNKTAFASAIKAYGHLESLSVWLDEGDQGCLDDISLPWEKLRSLKLYGLKDKLPEWSNNNWSRIIHSNEYSKLTKLDLEMATLNQNDIKLLGELPQLCILRVKQLQDGEILFHVMMEGRELVSYQQVKVLQIACSCSSSSLHVTFGSKTMEKLELLKVDCCSGSPPYQYSGLDNLRELKQILLVNGSNAGTLKQQLDLQLEEHPNENKPVVKQE
ncbi:hypothetical protein BRADI_1g29370v3 [Brachypodium distachyon]|uniref:Uncharacterized protein n=1 Tax=Brachypodium distachyon TaxID=15368 RepID=A0A2K2DLX7_BRADI|nr:hypothetical protein BRADI_1g29370v3 [Brachypodium distachyon]